MEGGRHWPPSLQPTGLRPLYHALGYSTWPMKDLELWGRCVLQRHLTFGGSISRNVTSLAGVSGNLKLVAPSNPVMGSSSGAWSFEDLVNGVTSLSQCIHWSRFLAGRTLLLTQQPSELVLPELFKCSSCIICAQGLWGTCTGTKMLPTT